MAIFGRVMRSVGIVTLLSVLHFYAMATAVTIDLWVPQADRGMLQSLAARASPVLCWPGYLFSGVKSLEILMYVNSALWGVGLFFLGTLCKRWIQRPDQSSTADHRRGHL